MSSLYGPLNATNAVAAVQTVVAPQEVVVAVATDWSSSEARCRPVCTAKRRLASASAAGIGGAGGGATDSGIEN